MDPMLRTQEEHDEHFSSDYSDSTARGERLTWRQRSLRMRKWISVIGVLLCIFMTILFVRQDAIPEAIAFGVIGLLSLGYLGWTVAVKGRRSGR
jgi:hypothetical protein